MEVARKRIRKDFAPLNLAMSLVCVTPNSPTRQVFNALNNEWEPDRSVSPTVILPNIVAAAGDGSWDNGVVNTMLASMVWKVDGVDISTIGEWTGKYTIQNSGITKGSLSITRNLYPNERFALSFEAVIPDTRFGINVPVKVDGVTLSTSDKSDDDYSVSIGEDQVIRYNPFLDKLLLYDYKVAHGIIEASEPVRAEALDENAYERDIPIVVHKGANVITTGFTVALFKVSGTNLVEVGATDYEVTELTTAGIAMDLRLVTKADYMLKVMVDDSEVARKQFSVNRGAPKFLGEVVSGAAINPGQISAFNKAMISQNGVIVPYAEAILKIIWKTEAYDAVSGKKTVTHNEGDTTVIDLNKAGVGSTYLDDWMDVYFEAEQKPQMKVAVDETDEILTDGSNILIFN